MFRIVVFVLCIAVSHGFLVAPKIPGRIVGGVNARIEDIPYQASVQSRQSSHNCGAVIISKDCLLTAAHCVEPSSLRYQVSVGSTHTTNGTIYYIKSAIPHQNFSYLDYDVAVLKLNKTIVFNKSVQPLKLATAEPVAGLPLTTSGWGATMDSKPSPLHLQRVSVPAVNRKVCARLYEKIHAVTDRMICAGFLGVGGKDACYGDSGGPLAANGILYGIVSWGRSCAEPDYPGVYANVANLAPWIRKHCSV